MMKKRLKKPAAIALLLLLTFTIQSANLCALPQDDSGRNCLSARTASTTDLIRHLRKEIKKEIKDASAAFEYVEVEDTSDKKIPENAAAVAELIPQYSIDKKERTLPLSLKKKYVTTVRDESKNRETFREIKEVTYSEYGEIEKERIEEIYGVGYGLNSTTETHYPALGIPSCSDKVYENGLLRSYVETLVNPLTNKVLQITRYSFDYDANGNFRGCEKRVKRPLLSEKEYITGLSIEDILSDIAAGRFREENSCWPFFGREHSEKGFSTTEAISLLITNSENEKIADKVIKEMFAFLKNAQDIKAIWECMGIFYKLALTDTAGMAKYKRYYKEFLETTCIRVIDDQKTPAITRANLAFQVAGIIQSLELPAATAKKATDSITAFAKSSNKNTWHWRVALSALAVIAKAYPRFRERIIKDLCFNETQARIFGDFGVIVKNNGKFSNMELRAMENFFSVRGPTLLSCISTITTQGSERFLIRLLMRHTAFCRPFTGAIYIVSPCLKIPFPSLYAYPSIARHYITALFHETAHLMDGCLELYTGVNTPFYRMHVFSGRDIENYAREYGMKDVSEDFATIIEAWGEDSVSYLNKALALAQRGKPILLQKFLVAADAFSFEGTDGREYARLFKLDEKGDIDCSIVPIERDRYGIISKIGDTVIKPEWIMKEAWGIK